MDEAQSVIPIDTHYLAPERMSVYLMVEGDRVAFVDNNTVYAVPRLMDALEGHGLRPEQVDYAIVTHIHLDHAGGTAELLARCPKAVALVHPKAKRHLANPSRLVQASRQLYGDQFERLYGDIQPVEEGRLRGMQDGERLEWGRRNLDFFYTLGHATHHFCIRDSATNGIFTGDSFGIAYGALQYGATPYIFTAATPTEFDPHEARKSVARILSYTPEQVYLGHYGAHGNVAQLATQLLRTIDRCEEIMEEGASSNREDRALQDWIRDRIHEVTFEEIARCGLPVNEETLVWLNPDIMLNAQGLYYATLKRRKRKLGRER